MTEISSEVSQPLPEQIGPYRIERELGSGGMGTVYLGRHESTDRVVAVKVLPPALAREEGFVARFTREIDAMRNVSSPQIVELYESGDHDGAPFYAMEYVPGETLATRLSRDRRIPWQETIEVGVQICKALKAAHNAGVVHRDLKPSNLLLREDGVVKLTDFGIAQVFASGKLTVTGGILGTAEYMSPEQAQGKRASKQSDIYSLGAVLYVMVTGRPPFVGKTALEVAQKHKFAQFDSPKRFVPEIPRWLDDVICKCLSKKPEDRYPDAYVVGLRLQEIPQLVDYSQQQDERYAAEGTGPTHETLASDAAPRRREDDVGGTFVRDVLRAHAELERKPRDIISSIFDNTWGLVTLLLIVVGTGVGLAYWSRPSDEQLLSKAQELMGRPEGTALDTARQHFETLLRRDRERWEPEVKPYLERIELYKLKRELIGRPRPVSVAQPTEPERILRKAHELHEAGETGQAVLLLKALQDLIGSDPEHQISNQLATDLLEQWNEEEPADRFTFLVRAFERAEQEVASGKREAAERIWRSIVTLYDASPGASEHVERARRLLNESRLLNELQSPSGSPDQ